MIINGSNRISSTRLQRYPLRATSSMRMVTEEELPTGLILDAAFSIAGEAVPSVELTEVVYTATTVTITLSAGYAGDISLVAPLGVDSMQYGTSVEGGATRIYFGAHEPLADGTYEPDGRHALEHRCIIATGSANKVDSLSIRQVPVTGGAAIVTDVGSSTPTLVGGVSAAVATRNVITISPRPRTGAYQACENHYPADFAENLLGTAPIAACAAGVFTINGLAPDWGGSFHILAGAGVTVSADKESHTVVLTTTKGIKEGDGNCDEGRVVSAGSLVDVDFFEPLSTDGASILLLEGRYAELFAFFTVREIRESLAIINDVSHDDTLPFYEAIVSAYYE